MSTSLYASARAQNYICLLFTVTSNVSIFTTENQQTPILNTLCTHCLITAFLHTTSTQLPSLIHTSKMYRTVLLASLAGLVASQNASTADAVSQIGDGQVQAPTGTAPEAEAPSVATSAPYENPFTVYTAETDSWGVITGMPTVVTSQPEVVTSQPTQPAVMTSQPVSPVHSYGNSTTLHTSTSASETASETESETGSSTGSPSPSVAPINESGAETSRIAGAGIALVVVSFGFFML